MDRFKKICSKGLVGLSAAAFALLPFSSPALAADAAPAPQTGVLAALKFPPLPTFSQNLLGAARKIYPSQEVEILPMFFLGGFGYPTFPGVSTSENITVFALLRQAEGDPMPFKFVALAKLTADSPTRAALTMPPYNLVVEDRDGWTLIARSADELKAVSNVAELVAINGDSSDFGLELRLYFKDGGKTFVKDFITGMLSTVEEPAKSLLAGVDSVVAAVLDRYDWLGYGISANADKVSLGMVVKPRPGTADAAFVNKALKAGEVNGAQYLSSEQVVGMVGRYDIGETKKLLNDYKSVFAGLGNEQLRTLVNDAIDSTVKFVELSDGSSSGVLIDLNLDKPNTLNISGGTASTAQIDAYYEQLFSKLVPQLMTIISGVSGGEVDTKDIPVMWEVRKDAATLPGGEKVSALVVKSPSAENPEKLDESVTYYAGVKGYMISGSDLEAVKSLAQSVTKGEAVASNLAKTFPLDAHTFGKGQVRTAELVALIIQMVSGELEGDNAAALKQTLDLLKTKTINPIAITSRARDGRLVYDMSLDSASIGALVKFIKESGALTTPADPAAAAAPAVVR